MVRIERLGVELRAALAMHDDGNGNVKQEILVAALQNFVHMSQNKIPIFSLDKKIQPDLEKLDKDKDGYLTIDEISGLGRKINQQRNRLRDVFGVGIVGFIFTLLTLGAVMGLSYLALDLNKDVLASRGLLTNREDGSPVKVSSSTFRVQGNVLNSGGETENPANNAVPIATSMQEYKFNEISGDWPNQALSAVTKLSIMPMPAASDDKSPFIHTNVDYIVRLPNRVENNGGSVVLLHTPTGRFVVSGGTVQVHIPARFPLAGYTPFVAVHFDCTRQPATGELATLDGAALHMEAVRLPSRRSLATASGRRQVAQSCNSLNRCNHNRRQSEIDCCDGQIYKCTTTASPFSCPRGLFCTSSSSSTWCRDRQVIELAANPYGCAGIYTLQYNDVWDGPAFLGTNCAYIVWGSTWYLIYKSDYYALAIRNPTILGTGSGDPYNIFVNGVRTYVAVVLGNAANGVYCPGSAQISSGLWYAPPFFRKCAPGFYCFTPHYQFPCKNLVLTSKPGYSATYAGTYYLSTQTYNDHPIYNSFKYQSCGYVCNYYYCYYSCAMVDYPCSQQSCGGAQLFAGLVYSTVYNPFQAIGGVYSIIPGASFSQVTSYQVKASSVAVVTRNPPSWSQSNGPTEDWTEFTGAWGARTLADVVCPGGSKLPTTGTYSF